MRFYLLLLITILLWGCQSATEPDRLQAFIPGKWQETYAATYPKQITFPEDTVTTIDIERTTTIEFYGNKFTAYTLPHITNIYGQNDSVYEGTFRVLGDKIILNEKNNSDVAILVFSFKGEKLKLSVAPLPEYLGNTVIQFTSFVWGNTPFKLSGEFERIH